MLDNSKVCKGKQSGNIGNENKIKQFSRSDLVRIIIKDALVAMASSKQNAFDLGTIYSDLCNIVINPVDIHSGELVPNFNDFVPALLGYQTNQSLQNWIDGEIYLREHSMFIRITTDHVYWIRNI